MLVDDLFTTGSTIKAVAKLLEPHKPEKIVPLDRWKIMTPIEKFHRFGSNLEEEKYTYGDIFIYEKLPILPLYTLHSQNRPPQETNYYMISFKNTCKINCKAIRRFDESSPESTSINTKWLELSALSRDILRRKLAHWYGSVPNEDKEILSIC